MEINLDKLERDQLIDLIVKLKEELEMVKDELHTVKIIWSYLCTRKDYEINRLKKLLEQIGSLIEENMEDK